MPELNWGTTVDRHPTNLHVKTHPQTQGSTVLQLADSTTSPHRHPLRPQPQNALLRGWCRLQAPPRQGGLCSVERTCRCSERSLQGQLKSSCSVRHRARYCFARVVEVGEEDEHWRNRRGLVGRRFPLPAPPRRAFAVLLRLQFEEKTPPSAARTHSSTRFLNKNKLLER